MTRWKRNVLRRCLNIASDGADVTCDGRLFHQLAPETGKACLPISKLEKLGVKLAPCLLNCGIAREALNSIGLRIYATYNRERCTVVDVCFHKRRSSTASITLWFRYNAFALPTRAELLSSIRADGPNDHGLRLKMHSWCGVCHQFHCLFTRYVTFVRCTDCQLSTAALQAMCHFRLSISTEQPIDKSTNWNDSGPHKTRLPACMHSIWVELPWHWRRRLFMSGDSDSRGGQNIG